MASAKLEMTLQRPTQTTRSYLINVCKMKHNKIPHCRNKMAEHLKDEQRRSHKNTQVIPGADDG